MMKHILSESLKRILAIESELGRDTQTAFRKLTIAAENFSQDESHFDDLRFWIVGTMRCYFGHLDAICTVMRESVVRHWAEAGLEITPRELARLQEKKFVKDGDLREPCDSFNSLEQNFTLAFKYFPRLFGSTYELQKGDERWVNFRALVKARNRVTHPQHMEDFLPAVAVTHFMAGFQWTLGELQVLLESCTGEAATERIPKEELRVPNLVSKFDRPSPDFLQRTMADVVGFSTYLLRMWQEFGREPKLAFALLGKEGGIDWNKMALRMFARAVVAEQEMLASLTSEFLIFSHKLDRVVLEDETLATLQQNKDIPGRYRSALEEYSRLLGNGCEVDLGSEGGRAFVDLVSFRDRLTHPKNIEDIDPAGLGADRIVSAWRWLVETTDACLKADLRKCIEFQYGPIPPELEAQIFPPGRD